MVPPTYCISSPPVGVEEPRCVRVFLNPFIRLAQDLVDGALSSSMEYLGFPLVALERSVVLGDAAVAGKSTEPASYKAGLRCRGDGGISVDTVVQLEVDTSIFPIGCSMQNGGFLRLWYLTAVNTHVSGSSPEIIPDAKFTMTSPYTYLRTSSVLP